MWTFGAIALSVAVNGSSVMVSGADEAHADE
jgi:hypothetical protein